MSTESESVEPEDEPEDPPDEPPSPAAGVRDSP
ncbi:hypothetical protein CLV56_1713 [Mumia flava]|uniref:Uncharacterized protein n=1 Tax=Mumia flava TaxID=1348852 RepID=A0A2M9BHR7_9ACTN|nr:hypothetical protein CLV56_1713 [Mumia flava]